MTGTVDSQGRVLIPQQPRDALGVAPGCEVGVTAFSADGTIVPGGPTARLVVGEDGHWVARSASVVTDEMIAAVRDRLRFRSPQDIFQL